LCAEENGENLHDETTPVYNPFETVPAQSKVYHGGNVDFRFLNSYFFLGVYPLGV
jgi:hypothetical protein